MEGNNSNMECQICLNEYSWRRRAKRLACQHTCCSVCLSHLVMFRHAYVNRDQMNRPNMEQNSWTNGRGEPELNCLYREAPVQNNSTEVNMNTVGRRETAGKTRAEVQVLTNQREGMTDPNVAGADQADMLVSFSMPRISQSDRTEISAHQTEEQASLKTIVTSQKTIICPWCRCVTVLAHGMSVNSLPDDEEKLSAVVPAAATPLLIPEFTPAFIRILPNNSSESMLPACISVDGNHHRDPARGPVLALSDLASLSRDRNSRMWGVQGERVCVDEEMVPDVFIQAVHHDQLWLTGAVLTVYLHLCKV
ncbi:uncharacterized protein LOC115374800 [Myripristis murdjan]|uniref:uncharacterized protein LOC115374800 n=1 Tax=Myripristis murdjan TaxID=586833 RepID=UPI001176113B|nr:uncharacterized protein LOC115374800 [Myripristis murdjan]